MKYLFYLLIVSTFFPGCSRSGDGEIAYKNSYNLNINGLNKKRGTVSALIAFENQYELTDFKLKDINVDISVDGIDVGTYYSRQPLNIRAQSEMKAPLEYGLDNTRLQNSDGSFPSSFVVQLKGVAIFTNAQGAETEIEFTHKETVHPIVPKKERRQEKKGKKDISEEEQEKPSRSELRKMKRQLKKETQE